jgi:hypothetical protein
MAAVKSNPAGKKLCLNFEEPFGKVKQYVPYAVMVCLHRPPTPVVLEIMPLPRNPSAGPADAALKRRCPRLSSRTCVLAQRKDLFPCEPLSS